MISTGAGNENTKFSINAAYLNDSFLQSVRNTVKGSTENSLPFAHFHLPNFLSNLASANILREELLKVKYFRNENDLNSLSQSIDVRSFDIERFPSLCAFRDFLLNNVKPFLENATGITLNSQLTLTASRYSWSDVLLPHDDSLNGRAIAFVLYLTPEWKEEYGGDLLLYSADNSKRPLSIVKRLVPEFSSLVFFPVRTNTWHSVSEVISTKHSRLSLNGWFHADDAKAADPPIPEDPIVRIHPSLAVTTFEDVNSFISSAYIDTDAHRKIKRQFAAKSELFLTNFLNSQKFEEVFIELQNATFLHCGPPDRRNVHRLDESSLNPEGNLIKCLNLFRSEALSLLISQWTGLRLYDFRKDTPSPPPEKKRKDDNQTTGPSEPQKTDIELVCNVTKYGHGSYTMADSQMAADASGYCLDVLLFFCEGEWQETHGGFVSYIALNDTEEILRVVPKANCAAVVFREPKVVNFTKYINVRSNSSKFFVLTSTYFGFYDDNEEKEDSLGSASGEEGGGESFEEEEIEENDDQ